MRLTVDTNSSARDCSRNPSHADRASSLPAGEFPGHNSRKHRHKVGDGILENPHRKDQCPVLAQSTEDLPADTRFRMLVGEVFGRLTQFPQNSVNDGISDVLRRIQDFAHADQNSLLLFTDDSAKLRVAGSSSGENASWLPDVMDDDKFSWYWRMMLAGKAVRLPRMLNLPPEAAIERERAAAAGVKSHLCLPLSVHGAPLGGIALTCFDAERNWPDELIEQLRVIGQILSTLLTLNSMEIKLRASVEQLREARDGLAAQRERLHEEIRVIDPNAVLVGHSAALCEVMRKVQQVSLTQSTVLILGETGTGKELVAAAIHKQSSRNAKPMVKVNCAALPSALVEGELFGREKGAYTGALSKQIGRFELADKSTIFLDEIADLPLELQGKLLRVLQEGEFERLGSPATIRVNARVIAATNRDLSAAVRDGTFREDLLYRLNVFTIAVPALREHPEDVPLLVWTFVRQFASSMAKVINTIPKATMEALQHYTWPGNVRQLRNVIEHAMIVSTGSTLHVDVPKVDSALASEGVTMIEMERRHILDILQKARWRVSGSGGAAEILGIRPTTLESRMQKLGLHRRD